jgi:phosphate/sulfate permease
MVPQTVRRVFGRLQLLSASYMAFEHGRNDGQKFMGVIVLTVVITMTAGRPLRVVNPGGSTTLKAGDKVTISQAEASIAELDDEADWPEFELRQHESPWWAVRLTVQNPGDSKLTQGDRVTPLELRHAALMVKKRGKKPEAKPGVPTWVILICAVTMSLGTSMGGWRIIRTMGVRIVKLEPYHGFSAETAAATAIGIASHWGIPLSTTHTINTAIMGVGASRRVSAVRWGVAGDIISAWVMTFPICFILGYAIAWVFHHLA